MPVFWGWVIICWIVSFLISGLSFKEWKSNVMFYGVRKLSRSMTKLSKEAGDNKTYCWETLFEYWWGFSIKYWVPFALMFLLFFSLYNDLNEKYGGYHMFWQVMGFVYPLAGILAFVISFFACNTPEPFDHDVNAAFDENDHAGTGAVDALAAEKAAAKAQEVEMTNANSVVAPLQSADGNTAN